MFETAIGVYFLIGTCLATCGWPVLLLPWSDRREAHRKTRDRVGVLDLPGRPPVTLEVLRRGRFALALRTHGLLGAGDRFVARESSRRAGSPRVQSALALPAVADALARLTTEGSCVVLAEDGTLGVWLPVARAGTGFSSSRNTVAVVTAAADDLRALAAALALAGVGPGLGDGLGSSSGDPVPMPFGR